MKIIKAIRRRLDMFLEETANAIDKGAWGLVTRHILIFILAVVGSSFAVLLILLVLWKMLSGLLGKVLFSLVGLPLIIYILYLSFLANRADSNQEKLRTDEKNHLEAWAEDVYMYVRDAMFLVLRAVSEYTLIVMPSTPSAVELPNNISVKDGYAVFHFFARVRDGIDPVQLKRDLNRTLNQMLRAHELKGIPSDLVRINGAYYSPLQILDIIDYGDSINIAVVFTDEKTIGIAKAKKQLNLEYQSKQKSGIREPLYEDEL